jgi:hypothetical protein
MRRTIATRGALAATSLALLAGCTGSNPDPTPSASAVDELPSGEIQEVPDLGKGWEGIRSDVTIKSCPTDAGKVTATGTVVNSADEARDISIVISWNAPQSTDPLLQLAVTKKDVPAGKTVSWKASGELPSEAGQCVILARSGTLGKD